MIQTKNNEPGSKVTYSEVPVEADGIPPWGKCFRRKGNQVIFKDTNGAQNCIRCFHLTLKSPNVIQIQTEGKSFVFLLSFGLEFTGFALKSLERGSAFSWQEVLAEALRVRLQVTACNLLKLRVVHKSTDPFMDQKVFYGFVHLSRRRSCRNSFEFY